MVTLYNSAVNSAVWPVPYACAQPYHPGSDSHGQLFRPYWSSSAWQPSDLCTAKAMLP